MPDHVVAFREKLLKTIATRCTIFSLKVTENRLAAGLRPDPLGELKRSPDPLATIWGPTSKVKGGKGEERREGRKEVVRDGGNGREGEGKGREEIGRGGVRGEDGNRTSLTHVWLRC